MHIRDLVCHNRRRLPHHLRPSGYGLPRYSPAEFTFKVLVGNSTKPGQWVVVVVIPGDFLRRSAGESFLFASDAVGVGSKDEQAVTPVGGADVGCSYSCPFRIEPRFGKVGEDGVKPKSKVSWDVFKECVSGS